MKKLFVSGSISITELSDKAKELLDGAIKEQAHFLIGDADGVDSLVQSYLKEQDYNDVTIYHTGEKLRNNLRDWEVVSVPNPEGLEGREKYTLKDIAMSKDSDQALMIWDGQSKGTLRNIQDMKDQEKEYEVVQE